MMAKLNGDVIGQLVQEVFAIKTSVFTGVFSCLPGRDKVNQPNASSMTSSSSPAAIQGDHSSPVANAVPYSLQGQLICPRFTLF